MTSTKAISLAMPCAAIKSKRQIILKITFVKFRLINNFNRKKANLCDDGEGTSHADLTHSDDGHFSARMIDRHLQLGLEF